MDSGAGDDPVAPCRILLVSGSLRARSTNSAALRTAAAVASPGIVTVLYDGLADLPAFNPDDDGDDVAALPASVGDLRGAIRSADAVVFSVPEYAGSLPGSFKNLLDWTIGDAGAGSVYGKAVAWINVSSRKAVAAHEQLRSVLGYAQAVIVERACRSVPVSAAMIGADGLVADLTVRRGIAGALSELASYVRPTTEGALHPWDA